MHCVCARRDVGIDPPSGRFPRRCFDRDIVDDGSPYAYLVGLEKTDRVRRIPRKFMLTCRVALLLRGLGARIGCGRLSMARLWRHEVRRARRNIRRGGDAAGSVGQVQ